MLSDLRESGSMRRDNSKLFFGVVVLLLGVVILLGKLRIFNFNFDFWSILWKLWPLVLVCFGVNKILSKNVVSGMIISVIGLLFLISTGRQIGRASCRERV